MLVLKSIGNFFVRIWRWIKETAWVQPLLIVGAIFAVIFSIPYITSWASSWSGTAAGAYFNRYLVSLEGELNGPESDSEADRLTNSIYENTVIRAYEGNDQFVDIDEYGEKFFLVFTQDDCANCVTAESAFRYLEENWNTYNLVPSDGRSFRLYTINASEISSTDEDYEISTDGSTAFNRYLSIHSDLFNTVGPRLAENPYKRRASLDDTNYINFSVEESVANFPTPSICLVDYSEEAFNDGRAGLSEVAFSATGSTEAEQADFLMDMWNHLDSYSVDNLFTREN